MTAYRYQVQPGDPAAVANMARATGFFSSDEVAIARELADEALATGESSGYCFVLLDAADGTQDESSLGAFACYGPIPGTQGSYDLYWIVVAPEQQATGIGRALLAHVASLVMQAGGRLLYADTSSRAQYAPTRAFYERCGFMHAALLEDFYDEGDGKVIFVRRLR